MAVRLAYHVVTVNVGDRTAKDIATEALLDLGQNTALWASVDRAITAVRAVPDYLLWKARSARNPRDRARIQALVGETKSAVAFLHAEGHYSGYKLLRRHSLVSIWATFEAFVEDFFEASFQESSTTLGLADFRDCASRKTANAYRKVERECRKLAPSYGASLVLLFSKLGVDLDLTEIDISNLDWGNEARNCLLHRSGKWDAKACTKLDLAPDLVGAPVEVSTGRFLESFDAVGKVVSAAHRFVFSPPGSA